MAAIFVPTLPATATALLKQARFSADDGTPSRIWSCMIKYCSFLCKLEKLSLAITTYTDFKYVYIAAMSRYRILKSPLFGRYFHIDPSCCRYRFFKTSPLFLELPLFITAKVLYFDTSLLHHWLSLSLPGCFRFRNSMSNTS